MALDKIRIRNLDDEVLKEFRNSKELIGFDSLDESVIQEIKNQTSDGALNKYNDRELRNRIVLLESNKLNVSDAQANYLNKTIGADKTYVNDKIAAATENINNATAANIANLTSNLVKKENGIISESMLSNDLQDKINLRYENSRRETVNSGVDVGDFNKLTIAVNRNTSDIQSMQSYINDSVVHVDDQIEANQLSKDLQDTINNSRLKTESITLSDMDSDLQDRLSLGSDDIQEIKAIQNSFNGRTGQTFFALFDVATGKTILSSKYLMACDAVLLRQNSLLEEAKIKVLEDTEHDIDYIIDSEENKLYQYNYETSLWEESEKTPHEFITGRFVKEYKTGDLFFSPNEDEYESILNISECLTPSDIEDVVRKRDINDVIREDDITDVVRENQLTSYSKKADLEPINMDLASVKEAIKNISLNKNSIDAIEKRLTEIETKISNLTERVSALETADKGTTNNEHN